MILEPKLLFGWVDGFCCFPETSRFMWWLLIPQTVGCSTETLPGGRAGFTSPRKSAEIPFVPLDFQYVCRRDVRPPSVILPAASPVSSVSSDAQE